MEQVRLSAKTREALGKGHTGRLRMNKEVPAVLYGPSLKKNINLSLNYKEVDKILHGIGGGNVLINLAVLGEDKPRIAMFKEISRHPLKETYLHVDLLEIAMDRVVAVDVPVHLAGKSKGVLLGGIMQHELRKIKVECLPSFIPSSIDVDVTELGIGQSIHIKDIALAEGIKALSDANLTVVSVVAPTAEVEVKTAEQIEEELSKSFEEKEKEKEKAEE
ncbi:MAG: 50S ribosomal protein L25 [Deltaproteobacteria bacterium]|nr:50S ribosomal protein L25 [Deltaproteobacteria bacterium]